MEKGACSSMNQPAVPDWLFNKAQGHIAISQAEVAQAKLRIPKEYHDFLVLLEQRVKLVKKAYNLDQRARDIGMSAFNDSTYVTIVKPYLTVDGRVQIARDEHKELGKKLDILAPRITSYNEKTVMTIEVVSEIYGTATGMIELGSDGAVDKSNPFANAQTSAIGRALGFLGYGLVGTGTLNESENLPNGRKKETRNSSSTGSKNELDEPPLSPSSKAARQYRVQILDIPAFDHDGSSSTRVMLRDRTTKTLKIHKQLRTFSENLKRGDVIVFKGWLYEDSLKMDIAVEPLIEKQDQVS